MEDIDPPNEPTDCLRCRGRSVLTGRLVGQPEVLAPGLFRWDIPRSPWQWFRAVFSLKASRLLKCDSAAYYCRDCGLVWTSIDPRKVAVELQRYDRERAIDPAVPAKRQATDDPEFV